MKTGGKKKGHKAECKLLLLYVYVELRLRRCLVDITELYRMISIGDIYTTDVYASECMSEDVELAQKLGQVLVMEGSSYASFCIAN